MPALQAALEEAEDCQLEGPEIYEAKKGVTHAGWIDKNVTFVPQYPLDVHVFDRCFSEISHQDWWVMLAVLLLWQGETHPCR